MRGNLKWKIFGVVAVLIWGVYYLIPNFVDTTKHKFLPNTKLVYGLDIQGGLHLVMGVDVEAVVYENLRRTGTSVQDYLKEKGIEATSATVDKAADGNLLSLVLKNEGDKGKATELITAYFTNLQILNEQGATLHLNFLENYVADLKKKTVEQSIETIRNRIDEFGVSEPSITAQGDNRILIQLPGVKDAANAKDLINRTAKLEFMLVAEKVEMAKISDEIQKAEGAGKYSLETMKYSEYVKRINEDLAKVLPKNTRLLFSKPENAQSMNTAKVPYVVETGLSLGGEDLKSASTTYDEYGAPEVNLQFSTAGSNKFADITGSNVNRQLAVVLDDVVYTAPNIKERIGGGSARITLGRGANYDAQMKEANLISMALRAGALPARLEQLEERTVGPTLGADSMKAANKAAGIGIVLIFMIMLIWYKGFGMISNIALITNGLLILAGLTAIHATLTLPGIAGIALTVGMAVDANVIIYERIREELKKGLDLVSAIREGFDKALSAILDANITTAATSAILMVYGTGPVRGFGVTLLIGIATSMFTAVFMTQTIVEFLVFKMKVKKISI